MGTHRENHDSRDRRHGSKHLIRLEDETIYHSNGKPNRVKIPKALRRESDEEDTTNRQTEKIRRRLMLKDRDERKINGFQCIDKKCKTWVPISVPGSGTQHRNHCNCCLSSRHLDAKAPGDRKANCGRKMEAIAIAVKGGENQGKEVMLVHKCTGCHAIQPNRVAGDDNLKRVIALMDKTFSLPAEQIAELTSAGIRVAKPEYREEILRALLGDMAPLE